MRSRPCFSDICLSSGHNTLRLSATRTIAQNKIRFCLPASLRANAVELTFAFLLKVETWEWIADLDPKERRNY
jgi:hypothetical protein